MLDVPSWTCQRLSCMISIIMWWLLDMDIIYIYYSTILTALCMKFSQTTYTRTWHSSKITLICRIKTGLFNKRFVTLFWIPSKSSLKILNRSKEGLEAYFLICFSLVASLMLIQFRRFSMVLPAMEGKLLCVIFFQCLEVMFSFKEISPHT
jgi:hypothetical protein